MTSDKTKENDMIKFKAYYYTCVTDEVFIMSFEEKDIKSAYDYAFKHRPSYASEDFDLFMDVLTVTSATIDDGLGNVKEIH